MGITHHTENQRLEAKNHPIEFRKSSEPNLHDFGFKNVQNVNFPGCIFQTGPARVLSINQTCGSQCVDWSVVM